MIDASDTTNDSTDLQDAVIAALRRELSEYGALLNLLSRQQEAVLDRKPHAVLDISAKIKDQIEIMHTQRRKREAAVDEVALVVGLPKKGSLRMLSPHFRPALRPLIEALVDEVNRLIGHTRRRAEQNQVLLARSLELAEELMTRINPRALNKTYSARGKVNLKLAAGMSRLLDRS